MVVTGDTGDGEKSDRTVAQLADLLEVTRGAVYQWIDDRKVYPIKKGVGVWRFSEEEVQRILQWRSDLIMPPGDLLDAETAADFLQISKSRLCVLTLSGIISATQGPSFGSGYLRWYRREDLIKYKEDNTST